MNLLAGGSFDGAEDYVLEGAAFVAEGFGTNGTNACELLSMNRLVLGVPYVLTSGVRWEQIQLASGSHYVVSLAVLENFAVPGHSITVEIDDGSGSWAITQSYTREAVIESGESAGYQTLTLPKFTAVGAAGALRIRSGSVPLNSPDSAWLIDDVAFSYVGEDEVQRGTYGVLIAVRAALDGINGEAGGYWNDFAGRVFSRVTVPELDVAILREGSYLALGGPISETEVIGESSGYGTTTETTLQVFGFVQDTKTDPRESDAIDRITKLVDDIKRAVRLSPTLSRQVLDARLSIEVQPLTAPAGHGGYGEASVLVIVKQIYAAADIGSTA